MMKTAAWSSFSQKNSSWTPPPRCSWVFFSFFSPLAAKKITLSAMLFEQDRYKQCSYQTTCLSPVFPPAFLTPTLNPSAFQDRWRVSECGCWDNFSSWEPLSGFASLYSSCPLQNQCIVKRYCRIYLKIGKDWVVQGWSSLHYYPGSLSPCCAAKISCMAGIQTRETHTHLHTHQDRNLFQLQA